jgi:hypothetical protein
MKRTIILATLLSIAACTHATDWLTEYFESTFSDPFDLNGHSITFTPAGTDNYTISSEPITQLPVDVSQEQSVTYYNLTDDTAERESLRAGFYVSFFGTRYNALRIGSNGYITFNESDQTYTASLNNHYDTLRIALFYRDLNPATGGTISLALASNPDRVVVTYEDVPAYGTTSLVCTAQCELFVNEETIRLSWIDCNNMSSTIVGLSAAQGYDETTFSETDFSAYLVASGDVDEDGLPDWWEELHFDSAAACHPTNDFDLDGFSNEMEYIANTDPTDEDSHFQIQSAYLTGAAAPEFVLNWNCQTGRTYSVLWSANPSTGFTPVNTTGITHPQSSFSAPVTGQQGFYKVEVHMTE